MDNSLKQFVREENIKSFKWRIAAAKHGPERDMLLKLLAEEEGRQEAPPSEISQ